MNLERKMPEKVNLGKHYSTSMLHPMGQLREWNETKYNPQGLRVVMGYFLPVWQRDSVWTLEQKISFIESAWKGISLGTYTYNQCSIDSPYDNLLIDGQQRLTAIEDYLNDKFPVFGYKWSEVTEFDRRQWGMTITFASYITNSENEQYLKDYYNLMNFSGTAHKENERA